jgi:hypothetical protein
LETIFHSPRPEAKNCRTRANSINLNTPIRHRKWARSADCSQEIEAERNMDSAAVPSQSPILLYAPEKAVGRGFKSHRARFHYMVKKMRKSLMRSYGSSHPIHLK